MTQRLMLMVMIGLMGVFLAACGAAATPTPEPSPVAPATPMGEMSGMEHSMSDTGANQPYDAMFIDSMIEHHQGAIDMARQAQNEAEKIEIKTLVEAIIKAQEAEITQMKTWRQAWYPDLPSTGGMGMEMGTMMISDDASKPFDQRFIEAMIPHHEGAIGMAKDAQQKAEHEEIKTLSGAIITAQEAEIAQMRLWLKEWFGL